jgi:uncharacterized spore protein YtfJ
VLLLSSLDAARTSCSPRLFDRIGARFSAATVYGSPIERDGVTVVPVAAARFGIGAGGGSDPIIMRPAVDRRRPSGLPWR